MDTTPDKNTFSLGWDSPLFLKGVKKKNEENRGKGIKKGPKKKAFTHTLPVNTKSSEDLSTES